MSLRRCFKFVLCSTNKNYLLSPTKCNVAKSLPACRCFNIPSHMIYNKQSQYEYDPATDSFRQKSSIDQSNQSNRHNNHESNKKSNNENMKGFAKRFLRNLCLLTGGIVWTGILFVTLFVDVNESEVEIKLKNIEDNVRLLAFYDLIPSEKGLLSVLKNDDDSSDHLEVPHKKEMLFYDTLAHVKENEVLVEKLGKPIQLCGYLAATKLNRLFENYDNITKHGQNISKYGYNIIKQERQRTSVEQNSSNEWKIECILDGSKGLALLTLHFERSSLQHEWALKYIRVELLDKSNVTPIFEKHGSLPQGITL